MRCKCGQLHALAIATREPRFWDYDFVVLMAFDCECGSTHSLELSTPTIKDDLYADDTRTTEGRSDVRGLVQAEDPFRGWQCSNNRIAQRA